MAVTDALKTRGRVAGVRTNFGEIQAEYVVNCAGMWARQLGQQVGEAPELKNYFLVAGLNSIGILTGGGVERVLATWTGFRFWRFSMHTA
jgi:glycine/D-amino acid oxidase-like deaminating enzyme